MDLVDQLFGSDQITGADQGEPCQDRFRHGLHSGRHGSQTMAEMSAWAVTGKLKLTEAEI